jgi:predicted 3-demethylubiquinone-9 3-methyltransferase (glyoxalase superfamily)
MQKITPFLWFDKEAEEAARHYISVFKDGKILNIARYGDAGPGPKGHVMVVDFEIRDQRFIALNGGPRFKFDEAISFVVDCRDQAEVDYFWERLAEGGKHGMCGWLTDKFDLSWQVVPRRAIELTTDADPAKAARAMAALLKMRKIDIAAVESAHRG